MPNILVGECKQEISSFNPVTSHYTDFDIAAGDEILRYHRGLNSEMGGALDVFATRADVSLAPTYSVRAITSGGTLAADSYARIAREFLESVRAAPPVDGVYLTLHGAMAAENEPDPEGYLLAEMRQILGETIPIVVSMDLHGIVTDRILQHSDAVVVYHTYPHVDFYSTGQRAAHLLLKILDGNARPTTALAPIPTLVRGDELITETGLFGRSIREAQVIENSPGGLSAGMFIGNPFTDVPDLRSNSLVVTDDDPVRAKVEAIRLAQEFWPHRAQMQAPLVSMDEAVHIAAELLQQEAGTVIFTDAADATSSGASGDSNALIRRLHERGYTGRVLAPLVDPPAVEAAFAAGVGATIETTLGGALDRQRFEPMAVSARVRLLSDGHFFSESNNAPWYGGHCAVLEFDNTTVVVSSRPVSLYDRSLFYAHGQDPKRFDVVVVKSPHCQPQFFDEWAARNLNVDAPGSTSANLQSLGHTVCQRPIYPLDPDVTFEPKARLFVRPTND